MKFFLLDGTQSKFYEATPTNLRIHSKRKIFVFDFEITEQRIKQWLIDGVLVNHLDYQSVFKELHDYLMTTRTPPKQVNLVYWVEDLELATVDLEYHKMA